MNSFFNLISNISFPITACSRTKKDDRNNCRCIGDHWTERHNQ